MIRDDLPHDDRYPLNELLIGLDPSHGAVDVEHVARGPAPAPETVIGSGEEVHVEPDLQLVGFTGLPVPDVVNCDDVVGAAGDDVRPPPGCYDTDL